MTQYGSIAAPLLLVFDIDSTLYTNAAYAAYQNDVLVARLARERGVGLARVARELERTKAALRERSGGAATSLGNAFAAMGVDIATSVRWREEEIDPRQWLAPDPELREALDGLRAAGLRLCAVTNNPRSVGERSLEALGVRELFEFVVGLDDTLRSKPDTAPFARACEKAGVAPRDCVSVGDRYDVDCAPALALGMAAVLVEGVREVYGLGAILA